MRVVNRILIGLGLLFLAVIALFVWVGVSGSQFRKEQTPFVERFVTDLSKRWDLADVNDRVATSFVEQARSAQAQQALHEFKPLGMLRSMSDLELRSYNANTKGTTGVFSFKGTFENGDAVVQVTLVKMDGGVRVLSLYLNAIHVRVGTSKVQVYVHPRWLVGGRGEAA
jgi:hypothetical protein